MGNSLAAVSATPEHQPALLLSVVASHSMMDFMFDSLCLPDTWSHRAAVYSAECSDRPILYVHSDFQSSGLALFPILVPQTMEAVT